MACTKKEKLLHYFFNAALIIFYIALTALVLYICLSGFFPAMTYHDYILPSFGLLFVSAAGNDISLMKINLDKYLKK